MADISDPCDGNEEYAEVEQTIEQDELYDVGTSQIAHEYEDGSGLIPQSTERTQYESHKEDAEAITTEYESHEDDDGARWVHNPTITTEYESHEDHDGARWVHNTTITTEYESHEYHGGVDGVEQSKDDDPPDIGTLIELLEKFDYDDGRVEKGEKSSGQDDDMTDDVDMPDGVEPGTGQYHPFDLSTLEVASKGLAKFEVEKDSCESPKVCEDLARQDDDITNDVEPGIEQYHPFDLSTLKDASKGLAKFEVEKDSCKYPKVCEDLARQDDDITNDVEPGIGQYHPFGLSTLEDASKGLAKFEVKKDSYKSPKVFEDLARQDDDMTNDVEPGKGQYHPFDLSTLEDASKGLAKFDLAKFDSVEHDGRVEKVEQGTGKSIPSSWVSGKKPLKTSKGHDDDRSEKSPGQSIPSTLVSGKKPLKTSKGLDDDRSEKSPGQSIPSSWVSRKPLKTSKGLDDGRSERNPEQSIPLTLVSGTKPLKTSKGLDDGRSEKSQGKFEVGKGSLVDRDKSLVNDLQGKIRVLWWNCECIIEDFTENFLTSKISPDTFDGDDPHEGGLIRVSHHLSTNLKRDPLYNDRLHHQNSFKSFQKFDDTILNLKNLVDIYTQGNGTGMSYPDFEIGNSIMLSQLSKEIDRFVDCEYWIDVWIHYAFIYWTLQQKPVLDYIVSASEDTEITKRVEYGFKTLQHPLTLKKLLGRLECHLQHLDKRSSTHRFPSGERALNHEYLVGNVHNNFVRLFHTPAFKELRKITKLNTKYGRLDENIAGRYQTTTTKDKM